MALAAAAGPFRCFASGWVVGSSLRLLRLEQRPFSGRVCSDPWLLGGALASFCLTIHAIEFALSRMCRSLRSHHRRALSGAVAGALLSLRSPKVAGSQTELHMRALLSALRTLLPRSLCVKAAKSSREKTCLSRTRAGSITTALACASSWVLLLLDPPASPAVATSWKGALKSCFRDWEARTRLHLRASVPVAALLGVLELRRPALPRSEPILPVAASLHLLRLAVGCTAEAASLGAFGAGLTLM
ncbi:MAG: hypothetical protein SGPRY_014270, partial [Prymnesium sp.]